MDLAKFTELGLELKNSLSLQKPIGLKFCRSVDEIPLKAKRPLRDFGKHMAICQSINIARSFGFTMGLTLEDNYCIAGASVFGLIDFPYSFYPHHVRDMECGQIMDTIFTQRNAMLPKNEIQAAGGEKVMANTSDYELDICFPANRIEDVLKGIKGTNRMLPYPMICTTMLNEPSVPDDYKITYKDL